MVILLTYTGKNISFTKETEVPTLTDIAVSLGRMTRYNGHSQIFWSVLTHTMCVYEYLQKTVNVLPGYDYKTIEKLDVHDPLYEYPPVRTETERIIIMLMGLLHDAAECIISDIPRGIKSDSMELQEVFFLGRILGSQSESLVRDNLAISLDDWDRCWNIVKNADDQVLYAELKLIGPTHLCISENAIFANMTPNIVALDIVAGYKDKELEKQSTTTPLSYFSARNLGGSFMSYITSWTRTLNDSCRTQRVIESFQVEERPDGKPGLINVRMKDVKPEGYLKETNFPAVTPETLELARTLTAK